MLGKGVSTEHETGVRLLGGGTTSFLEENPVASRLEGTGDPQQTWRTRATRLILRQLVARRSTMEGLPMGKVGLFDRFPLLRSDEGLCQLVEGSRLAARQAISDDTTPHMVVVLFRVAEKAPQKASISVDCW